MVAMKKKNEIWKWAGILAVGGAAYYLYSKSKTTTVSTAPVPIIDSATTVIPQATPGPPDIVLINDALVTQPVDRTTFARIPGLTITQLSPASVFGRLLNKT